MVDTAGPRDKTPARDALDAETYARVKTLARARLLRSARMRTAPATAARDHALILILGLGYLIASFFVWAMFIVRKASSPSPCR